MAEVAQDFLNDPNPLGLPETAPLTQEALKKAAIGTLDVSGSFAPAARPQNITQVAESLVPAGGISGWTARNIRSLPLDAMDEPSAAVALMAALRGSKDEVMGYVTKKFGQQNVRSDTNGDPIIKITDPDTGVQKEVPLNAHQLTANDLVHLLGRAGPEALGFFAGARAAGMGKTGTISKGMQFFKELLAGSAGQEAAGGTRDVLVQSFDKDSPEYKAIAIQRLENLPVDIALGYALKGVGEAIPAVADAFQGKIANPLGGLRTPELREVGKARAAIAEQTGAPSAVELPDVSNLDIFGKKLINLMTGGTEFPMNLQVAAGTAGAGKIESTLAEATGMPFFSKMIEYVKRSPAGASRVIAQENRIAEQKRAAMAYMVSPTTLATDEEVGREALAVMKGAAQRANQAVAKPIAEAVEALEQNIKGLGGFSDRPQSLVPTGEALQSKVIAVRDAEKGVQSTMRDEIAQIEGATGKSFPSGPIGLQTNAKRLIQKLPAPNKTSTEIKQSVDAYGNPTEVPVTKSGQVLEREFVPSHVVERLKALSEKKDYSLSDLIQMRTSVYEDISAGQAVPNTGTHYLNDIGKMLTEAIEKGTARLPEGSALKKALVEANTHYKESILPFHETGVHDLFKSVKEGGMEPQQIVRRLFGDESKYARTVQLLGKGGEEHLALQQAVRNSVYHDSVADPIANTLDAAKFVRNMGRLRQEQPQIYKDAFGGSAEAMITQAEMKSFLGSIPSGQLPIQEVEKALAQAPKISGAFKDKLAEIAGAYRTQQELYKNDIFKRFVNGVDGSDVIKADDFVSKLIPTATLSDLTDIMAKLSGNPNLTDQIARKLMFNLFVKSARPGNSLDIIRKAKGEQGIVSSGRALSDALGSAEDQKKLEIVLGPDRMNFIRNNLVSESGTDWQRETGGMAGLFAGGEKTGAVLNDFPSVKGMSREVVDFLRFKMISFLISNTGLQKVLSSTHSPQPIPGLTQAIVMSEPFVRSIVEDHTPEDAVKILGLFKQATGILQAQVEKGVGAVLNSKAPTGAPATNGNSAEFLK